MSEILICIAGRALDQDDGMGVYCRGLIPELCRQDRRSRFLVLLQSDKHRGLFDGLLHVETRVIPLRNKLVWDQLIVLRHALAARADVIFSPKFSVPLLSPIPSVFVLHGADWYMNPQNYLWWDNLYIRAMMPVYCWKASRLLAISQTIADDMVRFAHADPAKITVSYAAAASHFGAARDAGALEAFRARYGLPDRFILAITRVYHLAIPGCPAYPGANNQRLLRAYHQYRQRGGTFPLVIVGRGVRQYLEERGFSADDLSNVVFTEFIANDDIHCAYQLAEFFINVSLYESFSIRIVEALRTDCPIIISNTGACPEIAGAAARFVDPLDEDDIAGAMLELERSPEKRQAFRAAGRLRAEAFTWAETARRTIEVLHTAARARNDVAPSASGPAVVGDPGITSGWCGRKESDGDGALPAVSESTQGHDLRTLSTAPAAPGVAQRERAHVEGDAGPRHQ